KVARQSVDFKQKVTRKSVCFGKKVARKSVLIKPTALNYNDICTKEKLRTFLAFGKAIKTGSHWL
ncbi:MAG: hypothetical protein ACI3X6_05135, partial [Alloprevotella sp.]